MADEMTIGKLIVQMLLDDEEYGKGIADVKAKTKTLGVDLGWLADMLNSLVVGAFKAATAAAVGLAAASAYVGATFESKMQTVGVIAGATADEMAALEDKARDLGSTTNYSASQAADAMALLAGAGLDTNEVLTATGDALNLAGAGGASLDTAAAALTSTLSQFSLKADQGARVADVFAASTAKSQFTVSELAEAMKYGGTVGAGFGWSLEQTVANLAQFRDMGLAGAGAGTALRSAMVGATTENEKTVTSLKKYGLTMADINPETLSFAEILQNVGRAGMSTTDAMVVFGSEAGAVVKSLADKFAAGESSYGEMLSSLENASGTAASMYASMTDTVMGRFQNLQSAVEEFFLTTFDQYSGPLVALLESMSNIVNRISQEVTGRSADIQDSLVGAFGAVTDFLNQNADMIATTVADWAQWIAATAYEVRGVVSILSDLLPVLDDIALTMGVLWLSTKVAAFAASIGTVVSAVNAVGFSVRGLMIIMAQATGGIYALVAGVATLVIGLGTLIFRYDAAAESAARLKTAQDALKAADEKAASERAEAMQALLNAQRSALQAELADLAAKKELNSARAKEVEQLLAMTGATAAQMEVEGRLAVVRGNLRTIGSIVEDMNPEDLAGWNQAVIDMQGKAKVVTEQYTKLKTAIDQAAIGAKNGNTPDVLLNVLQYADATVTSLDSAKAKLAQLDERQKSYNTAAANLLKGQAQIIEAATVAAEDGEERKGKAVAARVDQSGEKEREYVDRVEDMHRQLADELAGIGANESQQLDMAMDRRLGDVRSSYAAQIAAAGTNGEEVIRLHEQQQEDEETLLAIWVKKRRDMIDAAAKAETDAKKDDAKRVQNIVSGLEERGLSEKERLEREKAAVLLTISEEYGEQKYLIAEYYDRLIDELEPEPEPPPPPTPWEKFWEGVAIGAEKAADIVSATFDGIDAAINMTISTASDFVSFFADGLESLTGFSFDLVEGIQAVADAMAEAQSNTISVGGNDVSTNVIQNSETAAQAFVTALIQGSMAFIQAAVEAIPTLITELVAQLPTLIQSLVAAIPLVIAAFVEAIPGLVQMFVAEAPKVIQALIDGLPTMIQAIVDAIPTIIQFIIDALPTIIGPLIDAAQSIMDALIKEIPKLIVAIIGMIPDIIKDILAHLPEVIKGLIKGIVDIVVAIVEAIPEIITSIIDALPDIITSLINAVIEAIPVIIMAVLDAIPAIIIGIIQGLPEILRSILDAIPTIITMILKLIPDIITRIIEMIPELLPALVNLIPELVWEILKAIPEIAYALIDGIWTEGIARIPEMVKALIDSIGNALVSAGVSIANFFIDLVNEIFGTNFKSIKDPNVSTGTGTGTYETGASTPEEIAAIIYALNGPSVKANSGFAYSGISYVPATMRMTVHPGEAVIPASRNPAGRGGAADVPMAGRGPTGPGGGGGTTTLNILNNGRLVEQLIVESTARGQTSEIKRMTRLSSGVKAGLDRGRYIRWHR